MCKAVLIDYGCHSFTYRLATHLEDQKFPISYLANGSLESPNLTSLQSWAREHPGLVRNVTCAKPYGKVSLSERLRGEVEWAGHCIRALEQHVPTAVIASTVPLVPLLRIQAWTLHNGIPFIYWLQDLQGHIMRDVLGRKFGWPGRTVGDMATMLEGRALSRSDMVITIAPGHEKELPGSVLKSGRHALLENWANIEEIPELPANNGWARRHGLDQTKNIVYSGTLALKHDLAMFCSLASALKDRADTKVVIVSSGEASEQIRREAESRKLCNLVLLPFQPYEDVPQVLASASVLIAAHARSEGTFCVPSKILSYLCAGRPTVLAINPANPAAELIQRAGAGIVVEPGDRREFIGAIQMLLDNPEMCRRSGAAARAYAEATFGMDRVVPRFLKILDSAGIDVRGIRQIPRVRENAMHVAKSG